MARAEKGSRVTPIATIGFAIALLAALAGLSAGLGYRAGWWSLGTGFGLVRYGVYGAIAAMAVCLVGLFLARPGSGRKGLYRALAGLVIGAVVFGVPWSYLRTAQQAPPIHDITTDLENPPAFVAILPLRAGAPNPPDYDGEEVAAQQRAAFPDIQPVQTSLPPDQAFERAVATVQDEGWQLVAAVPEEGRIEATETTFWWGFEDDIVIRVTPESEGSRIDVRSKSRVGLGDMGVNAARVEGYIEQLEAKLDEAPAG